MITLSKDKKRFPDADVHISSPSINGAELRWGENVILDRKKFNVRISMTVPFDSDTEMTDDEIAKEGIRIAKQISNHLHTWKLHD